MFLTGMAAASPYNAPVLDQDRVVERLRARVREVPGFPDEGILFYDITTVLKHGPSFREATDLMAEPFRNRAVDVVVAMESRGFIFGAPIAYLLGAGFAPIRKMGKLPSRTISREYTLEYASNTLEIHADAIEPGQTVLLVDDLLATGGTVAASLDIVQELGGVPVGVSVLVELETLGGREKLAPYGVDVRSYITYR
jgi:adenine phosphoribosyltransferase